MSEKYPRTLHLPWSPGATSDDKMLSSVDHFLNVPVVITEKMDGSNVCFTKDAVFARSHNGPPTHVSFDHAKQIHAQVRYNIPANVSVFGEYVFAVHSIRYESLPGYFLAFGVREDETGKWWSWEMVEEMAREISCPTVPVLHKSTQFVAADNKEYWLGTFETAQQLEAQTKLEYLTANKGTWDNSVSEGVVVRVAGEFTDLSKSVAKWVRANHVTTDQHWTKKEVERNKLNG